MASSPYLEPTFKAEAVGRGVSGVGFVQGDPTKTVGARVFLALARVLEVLLLDLRRRGSAVRPYVDVVLRCLVTLFLGEEGSLALRVRAETPCGARLSQFLRNKVQRYERFMRTDQHPKKAWGVSEYK